MTTFRVGDATYNSYLLTQIRRQAAHDHQARILQREEDASQGGASVGTLLPRAVERGGLLDDILKLAAAESKTKCHPVKKTCDTHLHRAQLELAARPQLPRPMHLLPGRVARHVYQREVIARQRVRWKRACQGVP